MMKPSWCALVLGLTTPWGFLYVHTPSERDKHMSHRRKNRARRTDAILRAERCYRTGKPSYESYGAVIDATGRLGVKCGFCHRWHTQ